jgi:hypothetical protein
MPRPLCLDCGHAAMYHLDRAVAPCAVDKPPRLSPEGNLVWGPSQKCFCLGYRSC